MLLIVRKRSAHASDPCSVAAKGQLGKGASSKVHQKSGPFAPEVLPGLDARAALFDSHMGAFPTKRYWGGLSGRAWLLLAGVFATRPRAGEDGQGRQACRVHGGLARAEGGGLPWRLAEAAGRGRSGGLSPAAGTTAIGNGSMLRA
jgi:hypothetical protein